eukprot:3226320-Rhodomonas_salina.1
MMPAGPTLPVSRRTLAGGDSGTGGGGGACGRRDAETMLGQVVGVPAPDKPPPRSCRQTRPCCCFSDSDCVLRARLGFECGACGIIVMRSVRRRSCLPRSPFRVHSELSSLSMMYRRYQRVCPTRSLYNRRSFSRSWSDPRSVRRVRLGLVVPILYVRRHLLVLPSTPWPCARTRTLRCAFSEPLLLARLQLVHVGVQVTPLLKRPRLFVFDHSCMMLRKLWPVRCVGQLQRPLVSDRYGPRPCALGLRCVVRPEVSLSHSLSPGRLWSPRHWHCPGPTLWRALLRANFALPRLVAPDHSF